LVIGTVFVYGENLARFYLTFRLDWLGLKGSEQWAVGSSKKAEGKGQKEIQAKAESLKAKATTAAVSPAWMNPFGRASRLSLAS
jgi:hypothetical protein